MTESTISLEDVTLDLEDVSDTCAANPAAVVLAITDNAPSTNFEDVQRWAGLTRGADAESASDDEECLGCEASLVSASEFDDDIMEEDAAVHGENVDGEGASVDEWEMI